VIFSVLDSKSITTFSKYGKKMNQKSITVASMLTRIATALRVYTTTIAQQSTGLALRMTE
jgi:hypothetical protein